MDLICNINVCISKLHKEYKKRDFGQCTACVCWKMMLENVIITKHIFLVLWELTNSIKIYFHFETIG